MSKYTDYYVNNFNHDFLSQAALLDPLFEKMAGHLPLRTLMVETVQCGLTAHTMYDDKSPCAHELRRYFSAIIDTYFNGEAPFPQFNLITGIVTSTNIVYSNLPTPVPLNSLQMQQLTNDLVKPVKDVYIIENVNVFYELMQLLPHAALICGNGNNRNPSEVKLLRLVEQAGIALHYLGDLDTIGIQIAAHTFEKLRHTSIDCYLEVQNINRVNRWVINGHQHDTKRTKYIRLEEPAFQQQVDRIHDSQTFVEQEELLDDYCQLIKS